VLLLLSPAQNSKPLIRAGRWGSDLSLRDFLVAAHAPLFLPLCAVWMAHTRNEMLLYRFRIAQH
jgi:hypothetical protein